MEEIPGLYFMRARYFSADAGVFFSTDPVKKIGPGWRPTAYNYANANPLYFTDPKGTYFVAPFSSATFGGDLTLLKVGGGIDNTLTPFSSIMHSALHKTEGVSAEVGATVPVLGYYPGSKDNWKNYTKYDFSGGFFGDFALDFSRNEAGQWGFEVSAGAGFGLGVTKTQINSDSPYQADVDLSQPPIPVAKTVGSQAVQVNNTQKSVNSNGGSPGSQSMSSLASGAGTYAQGLNNLQVQPVASSTRIGGVTTQSIGSGQSSGGNAFAQVVNNISSGVASAANSVSHAVSQVASTVGQAINTAVTAVGNFFSGLFGGHH